MTSDGRRRGLKWLMLLIPVLLVGGIITASFFQHSVPPGTRIVGKALPEKHPAGPCYQCHQGMATGEAIRGKDTPGEHPTRDCAQCHEGYEDGAAGTTPSGR